MTADTQKKINSVVEDLYRRAFSGPPQPFDGLICDRAEDVDVVLSAPDLFYKNFGNVGWLGRSRFNTDGPLWRSRRQLTQPSLASGSRGAMIERIERIYSENLDRLSKADILSLQAAFDRAATASFLSVFDCDTAPDPIADFLSSLRPLLTELQASGWFPPSESEGRLLREKASGVAATFEAILDDDPGTRAILDRVALAIETGSRRDAAEELLMSTFAATESSTATLSMLIDRLGVNLGVQDRIRTERARGGTTAYFDCFIKETLRYFPPIPFVSRTATADTAISGTPVRQGQSFIVSIIGVHHDPRRWTDPAVFDSARTAFLDDSYDRQSFIPFLRGPRTCGGMKIAEIELAAALGAFIDRFRSINEDNALSIDYALVMRPRPTDALRIARL